jgi:metal-sulfur cluster biosynthetic enzyme
MGKTMEENQHTSTLTKETVYEALQSVYDPEIPVSVVDLGLVYDVKIIGDWVGVKMTLTTPGCGMANQIANMVKQRVAQIPGVADSDVRIVWEPQWNPTMINPEARKKLGW